ncbi:MAG: type II secretion system protein [Eubacteriales bacterium]
MKNNKKRGFTLVELLVVIAILAILATVSVVGYTSFIERAAVSNDENVATQLNQFLIALKADSNGEFYGQEIDENNIWQVTQYILEEGGLGELEPQSKQHFYFDLDTGKYVVMTDSAAGVSLAKKLFNYFANAAEPEYNARPGNCFTENRQYFYVDTTGSDLANVIRQFYTFDRENPDDTFDYSEFQTLCAGNKILSELKTLAAQSVLVTKDGIFYNRNSSILTNMFFHDDEGLQLMETPEITLTAVDGKVDSIIVPENVEFFGIGAFNVTVVGEATNAPVIINKTAEEIQDNLSEDFTNVNFVLADGEEWKTTIPASGANAGTPVITPVEPSEQEYPIGGANPMVEFDIAVPDNFKSYTSVKENTNGVNILNVPTIVWHTGSVDLGLYKNDIVAQNTTRPVSSTRVTWALTDSDGNPATYEGISLDNGVLTLSRVGDMYPTTSVIYVTATAVRGDATKTFAINLSRGNNATITVDGATATSEGDTNTIDVLWGEDLNETEGFKRLYTVGATLTGWDNKVSTNFKYDSDIKIVVPASETKYSADGTKLVTPNTLMGDEDASMTFTFEIIIGGYYKEKVTITLNHGAHFFTQVSSGLKYVGTEGSTIKFSDLFKQVDSSATYENVKLNLYIVPQAGQAQTIQNLDNNYKLPTNSNDASTDGVFASVQNIGADGSIDFDLINPAIPVKIIAVVTVDGLRASKNYELTVVGGTNIREYEETGDTGDALADMIENAYLSVNPVFLNDITMSGTVNKFCVSGKTIYGNGFTFNVKNGIRTEEGIIDITNTRIQDLKLVGSVYSEFAGSVSYDCGSSVIMARGNSYIYNCYIANTRSPLRTSGNTIIEDCTLFGGRYSNIDITGGTVTIRGTVTTVQQKYSNDGATNVIGVGVATWFNDNYKTVKVETGAEFKQYNFMDSTVSESLPALKMEATDSISLELIQLKDLFKDLFTDTYKDYRFTLNGTEYVNSGMISLDKYMLNYSVTIAKSNDYKGTLVKKYRYNYTIKLTTNVSDSDTFTIVCPSGTYIYNNSVVSSVEVTGAELKAGVVFKTNDYKLNSPGDATKFDFLIENDKYKTLVTSGLASYDNLLYKHDMGAAFDLAITAGGLITDVAGLFHSKGIHYNQLLVDVHTPTDDNQINGAESIYYQYLREYLAAVEQNFFTPENYDFNEQGKLPVFELAGE